MRFILVLSLCTLAGCVSRPPMAKLPPFDAAMASAKPDEPRKPVLFTSDRAPLAVANELVPFAALRSTAPSYRSGMWDCWEQSLRWMPDAVLVQAGGYTGQSGGTAALAVLLWLPIDSTNVMASGVAMRAAPSRLPFDMDSRGFVRRVDESARAAGVIEADTVVALDGFELLPDRADSPHHVARMRAPVGATVALELLRPGRGRFTVHVQTVPNQATYLQAAEQEDTSRQRQVIAKRRGADVIGWDLGGRNSTDY